MLLCKHLYGAIVNVYVNGIYVIVQIGVGVATFSIIEIDFRDSTCK
jgi:hypothetical protein